MKARIFGAGSIGNHLSNALRKLNYDVEVIDIDQSALNRMESEIYPSRYGSWDDKIKLLNKPTDNYVDLEIIGTPPDTHAALLLERLRISNSSYWLVEKPFTIPDSLHIADLEKSLCKYRDKIFVGYNHSVSPAFINLLNDLNNSDVPTKISCFWEEHWGGIFNAHPWLSGPEDSYLGFAERGGGALMEHSHGLHLLTLLFNRFNLEIKGLKSSIIMNSDNNYDKKSYLSFEFKNNEISSFYSTDVISNEVNKSISVEIKDEIFSVNFSVNDGREDIYLRKNKSYELQKTFKKNRADDFLNEIKLIDNLIRNNNFDKSLENLSCEGALNVASICARIFDEI